MPHATQEMEPVSLNSGSRHKKRLIETEAPPGVENPFLSARQAWNERYGSYVHQAYVWRMVAFIALGIAAIAVVGVVWIGSQSKLVPYVVAVDKLGTTLAVQRADVAARPDERVIRAQLANWIASVRSVYLDAAAERAVLKQAYAMVNRRGPAFNALNEHFRASSPFERAKEETVSAEVASVLPISADTWRVEWREIRRGRDGGLTDDHQYQANISISINPPTDEATLLLNPMGIYVDSFSWSQRL